MSHSIILGTRQMLSAFWRDTGNPAQFPVVLSERVQAHTFHGRTARARLKLEVARTQAQLYISGNSVGIALQQFKFNL